MAIADKTIRTTCGHLKASETSGTGIPVLLIHGSGASRGVFARQMNSPLGEMYRMVALDLPGHGQSTYAENPEQTYTMQGFAGAVGEVLQALEIERAVVYGWSLGGHIGIEMLGSNPAVAGLMLTGTPPVSPGPIGVLRGFQTHFDLLLASKETFSERDVEKFARLCFGSAATPAFLEAIRRSDGRVRSNVFKGLLRGEGLDQKQTVEQARVPVAMVNGSAEPFARLSYIAGLRYQTLWEGMSHIIPDAGHAPFWEKPESFNVLFNRFITDVAVREMGTKPKPAERVALSA